ncbi:FAD dependent oxidoreductase [Microthyrium microscopicum]|uniref:FAD dependent oxidoreductase n=1 Tax=Microthyrium microscopicum TaxID=703497 RepID=A0A6A6UKA6_9PEZI|nr:FAD dependent oxidoreductase [Microthyrium microscopicum]
MSTQADPGSSIVIIGGGIIGVCTAYFLATHPKYDPSKHTITILEASSIASAASGNAGGLLALWAYPSCIVPLSFKLHAELAKELNGAERWGYRSVQCGEITAVTSASKISSKGNGNLGKEHSKTKKGSKATLPKDLLSWLNPSTITAYDPMSSPGHTAQVHPRLFTKAIASEAQRNGVTITIGRATALNTNSTGAIESISYDDAGSSKTLPASTVIVAAGPWSSTLLPALPSSTVRAHSIIIRTKAPVSAHALFTSISTSPRSTAATPEIYPRPDGTVYACGATDSAASLPQLASNVSIDESQISALHQQISSVSPVLADADLEAKQACYLPNMEDGGGPVVGRTKTKGVLVATGHTCWGIQNSCGTGKVVSEMVWEGEARSADVRELDPGLWGL